MSCCVCGVYVFFSSVKILIDGSIITQYVKRIMNLLIQFFKINETFKIICYVTDKQ